MVVILYILQALLEVLGKEFTPVRPPEVNHLTYSPLVRDFYEEQVRKFNLDEVTH